MPSPRDGLAQLRRALDAGTLDEELARVGVAALTAFGSSVDPDVAAPRDLDIGVVGERRRPVDVVELVGLLEDVADCRVDVVDAGVADPVPAVHALRGLGLWEVRAGALAEAQMQTELEWMDTRWLRQLELDRLQR